MPNSKDASTRALSINKRQTTKRIAISGGGVGVYHTAHGVDPVRKIRFEGHPAYGGRERALSPMDHVLASLAACTQITASMLAQQRRIKLGQFVIALTADFDTAVLVWGADGPAAFQAIDLSVEVETDLDEPGLVELGREVERRCPIHQLFVNAGVDVRTAWSPLLEGGFKLG